MENVVSLGKPSEVANIFRIHHIERKKKLRAQKERGAYFDNLVPSTGNNDRVRNVRAESYARYPTQLG